MPFIHWRIDSAALFKSSLCQHTNKKSCRDTAELSVFMDLEEFSRVLYFSRTTLVKQ